MQMYLKKLTCGNPLINFELEEELDFYEGAQTDEALVKFFHYALTKFENRPFITRLLYVMIDYATGQKVETDKLLRHDAK